MSVPKIDLKMDGAKLGDIKIAGNRREIVTYDDNGNLALIHGLFPTENTAESNALADLRARAFVGLPRLLEACAEVLRLWESGWGISPGDGTHRRLRDAYLAIAEAAKAKTRAERIEEAARNVLTQPPIGVHYVKSMEALRDALNSEEGGAA